MLPINEKGELRGSDSSHCRGYRDHWEKRSFHIFFSKEYHNRINYSFTSFFPKP